MITLHFFNFVVGILCCAPCGIKTTPPLSRKKDDGYFIPPILDKEYPGYTVINSGHARSNAPILNTGADEPDGYYFPGRGYGYKIKATQENGSEIRSLGYFLGPNPTDIQHSNSSLNLSFNPFQIEDAISTNHYYDAKSTAANYPNQDPILPANAILLNNYDDRYWRSKDDIKFPNIAVPSSPHLPYVYDNIYFRRRVGFSEGDKLETQILKSRLSGSCCSKLTTQKQRRTKRFLTPNDLSHISMSVYS